MGQLESLRKLTLHSLFKSKKKKKEKKRKNEKKKRKLLPMPWLFYLMKILVTFDVLNHSHWN
jgi:hypothetical protein